MSVRKPHTKSRYGCDNCRKRRVKCDETGPPCTNCILRGLDGCTFSRVPPARLLANTRRANPEDPVSPSKERFKSAAVLENISPSTSNSPSSGTVDPLELMHKFSTETYRSLCVSESEIHVWQMIVPRLALDYRYLMNGILALASLHIATTLEAPPKALVYIDTGLRYHNQSFTPFRTAIANIAPQNCDAIFAQSVITIAISIALPQLTATRNTSPKMTENIITVFELLQGVKKILSVGQLWINLELFSQGEFWKGISTKLDADTETAFNQLTILNDKVVGKVDASQYCINQEVISHLRHCFMKFGHSADPAPVLAWLAAVNKNFVNSLQCRQPFSLLVLMYWGVLLGELDGSHWWARNSGRALVSELLDELGTMDPLWEDCQLWVRRKMSL
ncbi:hypothetical protein NUU61_002648 [Penicillium alfredii]|uniref:Zn(2)-C6 fungal-type domain-containing protein n=1 Tax=Penicillium alfredii TaxID=1506179 RepID=A0A9W9KGT4_9EURO|nr:uncharacterized protein NUU61_002648 [Penicillium alfredii]KAJ5105301.1 hypothetical protein NUU61_002648 [Penicillium alfredii]